MNREDNIDWSLTTWEGSRRNLLEYWAKLTLDEIFEAQEDMAAFVEELNNAKNCPLQDDAAGSS
ncbi:MAG: hypothetical protein HY287_06070 [Planctomycetes bacterium]|nr:hypothetical protein [Planctomycetota bacterium]MBI3833879.1 hypothetical protein [Planctomycetota bacterium]